MRVVSFGGGVQSTALLVLAAQGQLECDAMLFANVGEDSENPDTLRYVREVAMPYAKRHGIDLIELRRTRRDSTAESLYQRLTRPHSRSIGIPVRLAGSGAPANRNCTGDFKINVIAKWCKAHGATAKQPTITMLGISTDEELRARNDSGFAYTRLGYPFLNILSGKQHPFLPRRMSRMDCINAIAAAGLPVPPKSSCWFCPHHRLSEWRNMRDRQPVMFAKACDLEATLTARKRAVSKRANDGCYMTGRMVPLAKAVGDGVQPSLFEDDACESGYCMV